MQKINTDLQVSKLDFGSYSDSIKIHDAMKRSGVKNINLMCRCSEAMVQQLGLFTAPTMLIIKRTLGTYGLKFNMTTEELDAYKDLPDDYFQNKDKEITEDDVEKVRSEFYATLTEKQQLKNSIIELQNDIAGLKNKKTECEQEYWYAQARRPIINKELENIHEKLCELASRLETSVEKMENHSFDVPEEVPLHESEQPQEHLDWKKPWLNGGGFSEPENETEVPAEENEEQPKEESDDEEDIECDIEDMIDLLSSQVLTSFLNGHSSSVTNYLFKKKIQGRWDMACENMLNLCSMSESVALTFFDYNQNIVSDLKKEMKVHGLKFGMSPIELDFYQETFEKQPKIEAPVEDPLEKQVKRIDYYLDTDPVMSVRSDDYVWLRFRLIEKSILSQPWWVKIFCSTEKLYDRAYKMAAKLYDMEIENMRNRSIDHFKRHMNDEVIK